jgi:hypothetical protein
LVHAIKVNPRAGSGFFGYLYSNPSK